MRSKHALAFAALAAMLANLMPVPAAAQATTAQPTLTASPMPAAVNQPVTFTLKLPSAPSTAVPFTFVFADGATQIAQSVPVYSGAGFSATVTAVHAYAKPGTYRVLVSPTGAVTAAEIVYATTVRVIGPSPAPTATASPTSAPAATPRPTLAPTTAPTATPRPTLVPTTAPSATPRPTLVPTTAPTATPRPTLAPTARPVSPTPSPTPQVRPSVAPTPAPTSTPRAATPSPTPTPAAPRVVVVPTTAPRSSVNATAIDLTWPDGSRALALGGNRQVPRPVALVHADAPGRITLQWLIDDRLATTSVVDIAAAGIQKVDYPIVLPPAGKHRVTVVQISNDASPFATPRPQQVITYAYAMPTPEPGENYYHGPMPRPKVTPLDVTTVKVDKIVLTRPAWGTYVEGSGLQIPSGANRGIPVLDDAVAFEWREKNPGAADRFVVRFATKEGKELTTVPVSSRTLAPDEALMRTLRTFAASSASRRGGRAASSPSEADVTWSVIGYKHIDAVGKDVVVEKSEAWPLAGAAAASGLGPCDAANAVAQPQSQTVKFTHDAAGNTVLGGTLDLRTSPYAATPIEYRKPSANRRSSAVTALAFDNVFVDWGDGTVEPLIASPKGRVESYAQRGDVLDLDGGAQPMKHRYTSGGTHRTRVFAVSESAAQSRAFQVDMQAAQTVACGSTVDPTSDHRFHFIALDLSLVGAIAASNKDKCAPWPNADAKLTYSGTGDVDFVWKTNGVEFARSRIHLTGVTPPTASMPANLDYAATTGGNGVMTIAPGALQMSEQSLMGYGKPQPATYVLRSPQLPEASFGKISVEVEDPAPPVPIASKSMVMFGAGKWADPSSLPPVKLAKISSKILTYRTPSTDPADSCTLIWHAAGGTFFITDAKIGYANDAAKAAGIKSATGLLGVFLRANADAAAGAEALNDNVLQYEVTVTNMQLPDGNYTVVAGNLEGTPSKFDGNHVEQKIYPISVHGSVNAPLVMDTRFQPSAGDQYSMAPGASAFAVVSGEVTESGSYNAVAPTAAKPPGVLLNRGLVITNYTMRLEVGTIAPTGVRNADGSTCPNDPYIQATLSQASAQPSGFWAQLAGPGKGSFILTGYGACGSAIPKDLNNANLGASTLTTTGLAYDAFSGISGDVDLKLTSPKVEVIGHLRPDGGVEATESGDAVFSASDKSGVIISMGNVGFVDGGGGVPVLSAVAGLSAIGKDYPIATFNTQQFFDLKHGGIVANSPVTVPNVGKHSDNIPASGVVSAHDDEIEVVMSGTTTSLGGPGSPLHAVATTYDFGAHFDTGISDPQIASTGAMSIAYPETAPQYSAQIQPGTIPVASAPGLCFQLSQSLMGGTTVGGSFALSIDAASNAYFAAYAAASGFDVPIVPAIIDLQGVAGGFAYHVASPAGVFNTLAQAGACDATVMAEDSNQIGIVGKVDLANPSNLFTIYGQMLYPDAQGNFRIDGVAWAVVQPSVAFQSTGDIAQYGSSAPLAGYLTIGSGGSTGSLTLNSLGLASSAVGLQNGNVTVIIGGVHDFEVNGTASVTLAQLVTADGSFAFTAKPLALAASVGVHKEVDLTIDDIGATFAADFGVGAAIQTSPVHVHAYATADFSASLCFFHCWSVDLGGDLVFDAPPVSVSVTVHTPFGDVGV